MTNQQQSHIEQLRDDRPAGTELAYAGIKTFLKAQHRRVQNVSDENVAVLGIPYDSAVSNRPGARYGPEAIRRASGWWAYLSGYKGGLTNMQTGKEVDFGNLSLADCGDVPIFPMDREQTVESIEAHVATVAEQAFPVLLGGDHYCTFPSFRGVAEGCGYDRVGLVQIDTHTDTVEESAAFGEHFHGSSTYHIAHSDYSDYEHISQLSIRGYEAHRSSSSPRNRACRSIRCVISSAKGSVTLSQKPSREPPQIPM